MRRRELVAVTGRRRCRAPTARRWSHHDHAADRPIGAGSAPASARSTRRCFRGYSMLIALPEDAELELDASSFTQRKPKWFAPELVSPLPREPSTYREQYWSVQRNEPPR